MFLRQCAARFPVGVLLHHSSRNSGTPDRSRLASGYPSDINLRGILLNRSHRRTVEIDCGLGIDVSEPRFQGPHARNLMFGHRSSCLRIGRERGVHEPSGARDILAEAGVYDTSAGDVFVDVGLRNGRGSFSTDRRNGYHCQRLSCFCSFSRSLRFRGCHEPQNGGVDSSSPANAHGLGHALHDSTISTPSSFPFSWPRGGYLVPQLRGIHHGRRSALLSLRIHDANTRAGCREILREL